MPSVISIQVLNNKGGLTKIVSRKIPIFNNTLGLIDIVVTFILCLHLEFCYEKHGN